MNDLTIVTTADGSNTLFNPHVGEHYHSKHGALQESQHVFLKSGLKFFIEKNKTSDVSILEVGFGTGLNFLLSAGYCTDEGIRLYYRGIEAFPLPEELIFGTGYDQYISKNVWDGFKDSYTASQGKDTPLNRFCTLSIDVCKLGDFFAEKTFDVIFFDAFAAVHQPEMWTPEALESCTRYLKPGGVFVTYAITGNLKRAMKSLGFAIEKAPGAPGKREMLRAVKAG